MKITDLITEYHNLDVSSQLAALVQFAHELTIVARDSYATSSPGLEQPHILRSINEIQHKITSHALALLSADPNRYPDDVLLQMILEQDDPELHQKVMGSFTRCLSSHVKNS